MIRAGTSFLLLISCALPSMAAGPDEAGKPTAREALKPFNLLIGTWRGTGQPEGTREEKQRGFWVETIHWEWQFRSDDAWLVARFERSKHFSKAELRYLPNTDRFQLKLQTTENETQTYTGTLQQHKLTVDRVDEQAKSTHRLVITLLHDNRHLYHYEVRPADRPAFLRRYQVGATKEGVPFASAGSSQPECIVSGGLGTMAVTYKGQTYYVCCTGCRDAFKDDPEKYIREFNERKAKEKKAGSGP